MKDGGVEVELSVWEGMWHGFHIFPNTTYPEAKAAFGELALFFDEKLK
jgi:acetyl esterase/lipase